MLVALLVATPALSPLAHPPLEDAPTCVAVPPALATCGAHLHGRVLSAVSVLAADAALAKYELAGVGRVSAACAAATTAHACLVSFRACSDDLSASPIPGKFCAAVVNGSACSVAELERLFQSGGAALRSSASPYDALATDAQIGAHLQRLFAPRCDDGAVYTPPPLKPTTTTRATPHRNTRALESRSQLVLSPHTTGTSRQASAKRIVPNSSVGAPTCC